MGTLGIVVLIIILINRVLDYVNNTLDFAFLWVGLILIIGYPFYYFVKNSKKKQGKGGDLLSQTLILLLIMVVVGFVWFLPEFLNLTWPKTIQKGPVFTWGSTAFRWFILSCILLFLTYIFGHENGRRGLQSSIGHIFLIFLGLIIDSWTGILFISLPILAAYYSILYRLALVTLPTSNPEDRTERRKRFIILVSYTWGIQFPLIVVDGNGWNKFETRIPGELHWWISCAWTDLDKVTSGGNDHKRYKV